MRSRLPSLLRVRSQLAAAMITVGRALADPAAPAAAIPTPRGAEAASLKRPPIAHRTAPPAAVPVRVACLTPRPVAAAAADPTRRRLRQEQAEPPKPLPTSRDRRTSG